MNICLFEDDTVLNFEPLTYSRPVYDLFCGTSTLKQKVLRNFSDSEYSLFCRSYLKAITEQNNPGIKVNELHHSEMLFINGRVIADEKFMALDFNSEGDYLLCSGSFVAAAKLSGSNVNKFVESGFNAEGIADIRTEQVDVTYADFIWDLIYANKKEIAREVLARLEKENENIQGEVFDGAWLVESKNIFIGEGAKIKPGVVIDASGGPVYIGCNSVIYPNAVIEGPVYIGESSLVKAGAKIYEGVSIGDVCKIGGEVEDSIIMSYSNKQHEGFIGHAYLGSWVNLGADTNCSDLRNNYGAVKAYVNGKSLNTGKQFLGLIIGDHSKTGINTMFNTGTVAGFSCNIYGAGFPDKDIPSFSWGEKDAFVTYDSSKAMDTAKKVMARRKKDFAPADEELFMCIFELTKGERIKKGYDS